MASSSSPNNNGSSSSLLLPGTGWTNGALPPTSQFSLHPYTRSGRLELYTEHRRMINLSSTWSRIGSGTTEFGRGDHSNSNSGTSLLCTSDPKEEGRVVRALVAQLCEKFYDEGWATGTGGGVSIRIIGGGGSTTENNNDHHHRPYRVFVAPSGVMKEDIIGDDIFELDMDMNIVHKPISNPNLRLSACTPLWYMVYKHRPKVMCVIHTHSMHAQLATLLDARECSTVLKVTHLEMLKGVGNHAYDDILEIPIIDNRPTEDQLADQLELVLVKYPKCNAVLVRRHGVYVWGDSWEQAKAQCESFDYLFESAVKMKGLGLDCGIVPLSGTYHVNKTTTGEEDKEEEMPPTKKLKIAPAFNASSATNNDVDMMCTGSTSIPLVPRDAKILLLDIEGTTTSISFVKDTLFPYVLNNMDRYIDTMNDHGPLYCALRDDINMLDDNHPAKVEWTDTPMLVQADVKNIKLMISILMKHDVKATGLKSFQGEMWKAGYASGELVGHLYSDFVPMMNWCTTNNVKVCIYSSGSVNAQKLLFSHTSMGDMTRYISDYFDTTSGSKREADSYLTIAKALSVTTKDVIFVSDIEDEIIAAKQAGMRAVVAVRPGNAPLCAETKLNFPVVRSLLQLCGAD